MIYKSFNWRIVTQPCHYSILMYSYSTNDAVHRESLSAPSVIRVLVLEYILKCRYWIIIFLKYLWFAYDLKITILKRYKWKLESALLSPTSMYTFFDDAVLLIFLPISNFIVSPRRMNIIIYKTSFIYFLLAWNVSNDIGLK